MSKFYNYREYNIIDFTGQIDACAYFVYKGHQISMSTNGRSKGGCQIPVCIFTGGNFKDVLKDGFCTVQEAIEYIDGL